MIDLKQILKKYPHYTNKGGYGEEYVLEAMKIACNKVIDRCLEEIVDEEDKELQQCIEAIRDNITAIKKEIIGSLEPTLDEIVLAVCKVTEIKKEVLSIKIQLTDIVLARYLVYYFARQLTSLTATVIGKTIANQRHRMVNYGKNKIKSALDLKDKRISFMVERITQELNK